MIKKITQYYYVSYFKFFKFWQSDFDAARNSKGMIAIVLLFLWFEFLQLFNMLLIFDIPLNGSAREAIFFLLGLPISILVFYSVKSTYPNEKERNLLRGIVVTLTIPVIIFFIVLKNL